MDAETPPSEKISPSSRKFWTIPNTISLARIFLSPSLIVLAVLGEPQIFLWAYLALALSDWVDGKLAILLNQRSVFGARLDTWSDAALYASLLIGAFLLWQDILIKEVLWLLPALLSYAISVISCLAKFKRWPSYHTRLAKICWFMVLIGIFALSYDVSIWPLRIALAVLTFGNVETSLITWHLPKWQADVSSILAVKRQL